MITLFCILDGEPFQNAFRINISNLKTIGDLRDLVRDKRMSTLRELGAADLYLYRVSIPMGDLDALADATREIAQGKTPVLDPLDLVSEVSPNQPVEQIHIFVQRPSKLPSETSTV